jgi:GntR family transcriptional regulator, rspAB operon transcriptional repressor
MIDSGIARTIPEQIATRLRHEIISGSLEAGEPLREKEVADRFGVSRGPIREVFRQLTQQGLLDLTPNKGVRVSSALSLEVRPLIANLRFQIEVFILETNFETITADNIANWEAILEKIKVACQRGDREGLMDLDIQFHQALIQAFEDQGLFTIWQTITLRMAMRYRRHGDLMDSFFEHKQIIAAIQAGDKTEMIAALKANIQ